MDDQKLGRASVSSVLAEHFGAQMLNEPKFQQVVERVTETLQTESGSAKLMLGLLRDLRAAAR